MCSPMRDPLGSRRVAWLLVCGALALTAAACGGSDDDTTSGATSAADTARCTGRQHRSRRGAHRRPDRHRRPVRADRPGRHRRPQGLLERHPAGDRRDQRGGWRQRPAARSSRSTDIDMLTPEGVQTAFQTLADKKVDAIVSPFVITYQPALDVAAAADIPYLSGGTSSPTVAAAKANPDKYWNFVAGPVRDVLRRRVHPVARQARREGHLEAEEQQGRPRRRRLRVQPADRRGREEADRGQRRQVGAGPRGAGDGRPAVRLVVRDPEAQGIRRRRDHDRPLGRRRARELRPAVLGRSRSRARSCTCSTARPSPSSSTSPPSRPRASTGAPSSACRTPARAPSSAPRTPRSTPTRRSASSTPAGATTWCRC